MIAALLHANEYQWYMVWDFMQAVVGLVLNYRWIM